MHINFLTVNKLDEEKILLILRITKMPMEPQPPSQLDPIKQTDRLTDLP